MISQLGFLGKIQIYAIVYLNIEIYTTTYKTSLMLSKIGLQESELDRINCSLFN